MSPVQPKTTRSVSKTQKVLSLDELAIAISDLRHIQEETLTQCKALHTSQTKKFGDLQMTLNSLNAQINDLRTQNANLRTELSALQDRFLTLETNVTSSSPSAPAPVPVAVTQLMHELSERKKCSCNVIAYGVSESSAPDVDTRVADDLRNLTVALSPLSISLPMDIKMFRLGKPTGSSTRPLKIVFNNSDHATKALSAFRLASTDTSLTSTQIKLVRDKTVLERELLRNCHAELDRRKNSGESNLTISYVNGTPSVTNDRRLHKTQGNASSASKN